MFQDLQPINSTDSTRQNVVVLPASTTAGQAPCPFDGEGKDFVLQTFEQIKVPLEDLSSLRGELIERTKDLHEAQQKLSDQRIMLQEEREKSARLLAENASHHCQAEDDRGRIAQLLRIAKNDMTGQTTATSDVPLVMRPVNDSARNAKRLNTTMSLRSFVSTGTSKSLVHQDHASFTDPSTLDSRINCAMQAPPGSSLVQALREEMELSKTQLAEQRRAFEADREARMSEERARYRQQEDSLVKYKRTVDHLQAMLGETTKDLCLSRQKSQITERALRGEVEALQAEVAELTSALEKEKCRRTADMKESLYAAAVRSNDVLERVRLAARDKELSQEEQLRVSSAKVLSLEQENVKLKTQIKNSKQKTAALETRFRLQEEGLRSELNLCRQELRTIQKRVYFSFQRDGIPETGAKMVMETTK